MLEGILVAIVDASLLRKAMPFYPGVDTNLIHARGAPPEAKYTFKHALVQDTAYASLLRGRRQRIHADIAKTLVEGFLDQVDSARAVIAHHYTEAGLYEPAAR
ncbi:MAG TPA: hypothetical protein VF713_19670, partial [Thermoanaerobaculia bacterium]